MIPIPLAPQNGLNQYRARQIAAVYGLRKGTAVHRLGGADSGRGGSAYAQYRNLPKQQWAEAVAPLQSSKRDLTAAIAASPVCMLPNLCVSDK